jgi:hypothetical protein
MASRKERLGRLGDRRQGFDGRKAFNLTIMRIHNVKRPENPAEAIFPMTCRPTELSWGLAPTTASEGGDNSD